MSTVLRIQIASAGITWSTNYDFDENETVTVLLKPKVSSQVLIADVQAPSLLDKIKPNVSSEKTETRKIIEVIIAHAYQTTQAKVQAIYGSSGMCRVYYKYGISSGCLIRVWFCRHSRRNMFLVIRA